MYSLQESHHEHLTDLAQVAEEEELGDRGGDRDVDDEEESLEPVMFPGASPGGSQCGGSGDSGGASVVNFNVDSLKGMLKCVGCARFLFPPILQCIAGKHIQNQCYYNYIRAYYFAIEHTKESWTFA